MLANLEIDEVMALLNPEINLGKYDTSISPTTESVMSLNPKINPEKYEH